VERFVNKLDGINKVKIIDDLAVSEPYLLITFTTGMGMVPNTTVIFLDKNFTYLRGVIASGNRAWGSNYAKAADMIVTKYNVPLIHKFELSGNSLDIEIVKAEVKKLDE
jgi:protein involved in ribonucleotide reduction